MKVKCPKCGHEFDVEGELAGLPITIEGGLLELPTDYWTEECILYCGPYKKAVLSCGHSFQYEFSQFHKGQKVWCQKCGKHSKVVKLIDTVTGKEHDRL